MTWRPLLLGTPLEETARRAIDAIAARLGGSPQGHERAGGLADGNAGIALFLGRLAVGVPGYRRLLDLAGERIDAGAAWLVDATPGPGLFHGFTGLGWVSDHLRRVVGEVDHDLNADLDAALIAGLPAHFDLVTGLVGVGIYTLERLGAPSTREILGRIVDELARIHARDGLFTPVDQLGSELAAAYPNGYVDLGLAHGIPGVIAWLARAGMLDHPRRAAALDLMRSLIDELLPRRMGDLLATEFPARVAPSGAPRPARSAWCYGDAGIALTLLRAASAVELTTSSTHAAAWRRAAIAIARRAAVRPPDETGNLDGTLCHGAAGYAHVLARLHEATGDELVHAAAMDWYARALDAQTDPLGFYTATASGPVRANDDLLHGVAGIGLVLTSAICELDPDWDRALLLS